MAINNTDPREIGISGLSGLKGINQRKQPKYIDLSYNQDVNTARQASKYSGIYATKSGIGANTNPDYGSSMFDTNVENMEDILDLNEVRANNLWGIAKLGAGALKAVTTAGTTLADGTIGLVAGLIQGTANAASDWDKDKGFLTRGRDFMTGLWDNEFSNAMREVGEYMELALPNYLTREELENEWYLNMGTANFWADFIKLIGFTVGAYYSGAAWNKALKGIGLLNSASKAGKLGATLSAVNEGRIEANNNANDWYKGELAKLQDTYKPLVAELEALPETFSKIDGVLVNNKLLLREALLARYLLELQALDARKAEMGNVILAFNTPLLMASNMILFDKLYQAGFASSKRAAGTAYKEGNKYIWKNLTTKDALKEGGKRFLSEGLEEMSLMWISEGAGIAQQYDSPDAYYKALTDPNAENLTKGFVKGITEGFMNSYGDFSKYQDFVMGGLTGLLGTPTFGKSLNSSSETYLGRGKTIGLSGGLFGAWKANTEANRVGNLAVEGINQYLLNTANRARHLVAENYFTDAMDGWSRDNNSFEYHNASDNAEFNAIDNFALVGLLDDYKELIDRDFDSATLEDLIEIAESTKNKQTGEYLFLDATGQSLAVSNPELMRLKLNEKKQRLIEGVDAYEKYLALMRAYTNIKDNDDAIRELAWLRWKIDRFLGRKETLAKELSDFIDTLVGSLARSLLDLELELRDIETANPEDLTEDDKKVLKENKQRQLNISTISNILKEWKEGRFYNTLSKESLDFLLEQDFQTLYAYDNDLDYATYRESMLSIIDLLALNNLLKLFLDKLLYYLDESLPNKHRKSTTQLLSTQTSQDSDINIPVGRFDDTEEINPIEDKINDDHAERDNQVAEDNAIQLAQETQEEVNNILTLEDLDNAVLNNGLETVNAVIDDIALTEPNHPAVLRLLIELTLDTIFDGMNDTLQDYPDLWLAIKNTATLVNNVDELKNELLNSSDNAIGAVIGFAPENFGTDRFNRLVGAIKLQLSDLFNKNAEDANTSQLLANPTLVTPSTTPQLTTGSDDNVSNDTSLTTPNTNTTDDLIQQSIAKWKKQGIGDNLIIQKGVDAGIPRERMLELMDIYNEANKPVTEEEGAITPTYTSEQGTNIETTVETLNNLDLQDPKPEVDDLYKFFITSTTEYPTIRDITNNVGLYAEKGWVTITGTNAQGKPIWKFNKDAFNYDAWVDTHKAWTDELKQSLKVRHLYLQDNHAYERISHGEVFDVLSSNKTEISLVTYADINEKANDLVVFLVDLYGHVLGDLPSDLSTVTSRYEGLKDLLTEISKNSNNGNQDYTYPIKTHINKIMLGRPSYSVDNHTIEEINPNLNLGICTNESLKTIVSASSDKAPIVDKDNILAPLNPKKGLIYVLLPNGRKGLDYQGYTPVLCTTPRLGSEIANTIIREKIVECLTKMTLAKDFGLLLTAFTLLDNYLWIPDLMVNAFNGKDVLKSGDNRPITEVVIKRRLDPNNKLSELQTVIKFNPNDPNALKNVMLALVGTPIHINIKFLNTEDGRKMYNEIVRTNLPIGTETTINDWFTINPIINGKELKAESPRTTGINPNVHTSLTIIPYKGGTITLDYANNKVLVNNAEQLPLATENPLHLTSDINRAYAKMFIDKNPNARLINGIIETPYGWYDAANKKLVKEPIAEQPMLVLGKVIKGSELIIENQQPSSLKISDEDSRKSQLEILKELKLKSTRRYWGDSDNFTDSIDKKIAANIDALQELYDEYKQGKITKEEFLKNASGTKTRIEQFFDNYYAAVLAYKDANSSSLNLLLTSSLITLKERFQELLNELNQNEPSSIEKRIIIDSSLETGMTQVYGYKPNTYGAKDDRALEFWKKRKSDSRGIKNPATGKDSENFYLELPNGTSLITFYSDKNNSYFGRNDGMGISLWRKLMPLEVKTIQDYLWEGTWQSNGYEALAEFIDKVMHNTSYLQLEGLVYTYEEVQEGKYLNFKSTLNSKLYDINNSEDIKILKLSFGVGLNTLDLWIARYKLEVLLTLLLEVDPDVLGLATINGKTEDILLSELLEALDFGYGTELTLNSDINDIVKAIVQLRESFDGNPIVLTDVKAFNRTTELTKPYIELLNDLFYDNTRLEDLSLYVPKELMEEYMGLVYNGVNEFSEDLAKIIVDNYKNGRKTISYKYEDLSQEQLDYLNDEKHGMTRELYESLTTEELEQYFTCMGV